MSDYQYEDPLKTFTIKNGVIKGIGRTYIEEEKSNFGEFLRAKMMKNSQLVGQVDTVVKSEETFGSMLDRSIKCAVWLQSQNIKSGDVIAICTHNHLDQIIPALAALYIGAIFNPWWDYGLTKDIATHLMGLTQPKILFVNEACAKICLEVAKEINPNMKTVVFGHVPGLETFEIIICQPTVSEVENFKCAELSNMDHPAYILHTSGTTGLPKGALHSHRSLFGNVKLLSNYMDNCHNGLWYATLGWITGTLACLAAILRGLKRFIDWPFDPAKTREIIQNYKIDWLIIGTSMGNRLVAAGNESKYNMSCVKLMLVGGAPLRAEIQDRLAWEFTNAQVIQVYGSTELGGIVTEQRKNHKKNTIGSIVADCELKIVDTDANKILSPNQEGELFLKTPYMMLRYWRNPEKTEEAVDSQGWFHTGDLGYYDEDGEVFIIDRLKELIKWRSHHVPPAVIELLIQTLSGVVEVAVIGVPHLEDDELPMAFVVTLPGSNVTEKQIHELVDEKLPDQMKLRAGIKFLDQIPHTASGKISRQELKALGKIYSQQYD